MQRAEIWDILEDWNFWKKDIEVGYPRNEYLSRLTSLTQLNEIVVVSGVRRSGKSTLLLQYLNTLITNGVRREDTLIINLEDPRWKRPNLELLNNIYEIYLTEHMPSKVHYVFLDEVQVIEGWEKFARFLHENKKAKVFITGSSSKLLSSEYATVLTGRHVDMEVFPLSFSEFLLFRGIALKSISDISSQRHQIQRLFKEYVLWGGFPKIVLTKSEEGKRELLTLYFNDMLIKDIVSRHNIKEIDKLEELSKYYLTNIAQLQSFNNLKNVLRLNLDTVERFSHYLSSIYILYFVKKFSYSNKEQLVNPKKVYAVDTGLRNSVSFIFSHDRGKLAENIVFTKLRREGHEIYYWKDAKQREVDFIVKDKSKIKAVIQTCWNINEPKTKEREVQALLTAAQELHCTKLQILTEDYEGEEKNNHKTITYIPLWKWLLTKEF